MKPEAQAEIILWDWLKTKSLNVIEVYFNRINEINAPKFRVEGKCKKIPDFVFSFQTPKGIEFAAVEIKDASKSINVQGSQKILDYYKNYYLEKTKYFIKDKEIKINYFFVGTNNSVKGFLFNKEDKEFLEDNKIDHEKLLKYNKFPRYEYRRTHDFTRGLISRFKDLRKELKTKDNSPGMGVLISNTKIDSFPYFHGVIYLDNSYFNKKSQWAEKFRRL